MQWCTVLTSVAQQRIECFFLHLHPFFSHPHILLKFQICPSVKKDKNRKFVLLSTHSENEERRCLVLVFGAWCLPVVIVVLVVVLVVVTVEVVLLLWWVVFALVRSQVSLRALSTFLRIGLIRQITGLYNPCNESTPIIQNVFTVRKTTLKCSGLVKAGVNRIRNKDIHFSGLCNPVH